MATDDGGFNIELKDINQSFFGLLINFFEILLQLEGGYTFCIASTLLLVRLLLTIN